MTAFLCWVLTGIALWHFAVLVPDRFWGGIIGAFVFALFGGIISGWLLPVPGWNTDNPPGVGEALWAVPGSVAALAFCWWYGDRRMRATPPPTTPPRPTAATTRR